MLKKIAEWFYGSEEPKETTLIDNEIMEDTTSCVHNWELTAKTYAGPIRPLTNTIEDMELLSKVLFGVTTYVWQCQKCGDMRKEEVLGSDENQLLDVLERVDRGGGALQYIKENNKVYAIMEYVPEIK